MSVRQKLANLYNRLKPRLRPKKPMTQQDYKLLFFYLSLLSALFLFAFLTQQFTQNSLYQALNGTQHVEVGYVGNGLTTHLRTEINTTVFKATVVNFSSAYYEQFLQISLAISAALIGIYAIIFIEIIKSLNERVSLHKHFGKIKYTLLFLAILPLPLLGASLFNIYQTFFLYQSLSQLSQSYLALTNVSSYSNATLTFTTNLTIITNKRIEIITATDLRNYYQEFQHLLHNSTNYQLGGLGLIMINLVLYTLFLFYTDPPHKPNQKIIDLVENKPSPVNSPQT